MAGGAAVSFRAGGRVCEREPWETVSSATLAAASPWRTFRWHRGQQHYSGVYWSATMQDHVIYESRLELARLLFADFDPSVHHIGAQPFLLQVEVGGELRRHIPDYLLITDGGPVVVDVKPADRLSRPEVAFTFAWTRPLVQERGWRYEVWSEPEPVELENLRFLAGFRRRWLFDAGLLEEIRAACLAGGVGGEVAAGLPARDPAEVRAGLLHLLWTGELVADLSVPLGPASGLGRRS